LLKTENETNVKRKSTQLEYHSLKQTDRKCLSCSPISDGLGGSPLRTVSDVIKYYIFFPRQRRWQRYSPINVRRWRCPCVYLALDEFVVFFSCFMALISESIRPAIGTNFTFSQRGLSGPSSVTFLHSVKVGGRNGMLFCKDTSVVPSNIKLILDQSFGLLEHWIG